MHQSASIDQWYQPFLIYLLLVMPAVLIWLIIRAADGQIIPIEHATVTSQARLSLFRIYDDTAPFCGLQKKAYGVSCEMLRIYDKVVYGERTKNCSIS